MQTFKNEINKNKREKKFISKKSLIITAKEENKN